MTNLKRQNALLDILIWRVSPTELRNMVFRLLGVGAYDELPADTHTEKCIAFVEQLHRRNLEGELLLQLSKIRPDIVISELDEVGQPIDKVLPERDEYSAYHDRAQNLLSRLGDGHPRYAEALVYQQRLNENISRSRRYGDTEVRRAERAEILAHLNALALSAIGIRFSELDDASE